MDDAHNAPDQTDRIEELVAGLIPGGLSLIHI